SKRDWSSDVCSSDLNVTGTGEHIDYPVQAVYRAVGYYGTAVEGVPFDERRGVITNEAGRVLDADGQHDPGTYATGGMKRGPVGLIGYTKGDARETIGCLLADVEQLPAAEVPQESAVIELLESRGVQYTTWEGWLKLDEYEMQLGEQATEAGPVTRERVKVVPRADMVHRS